MAETLLPVVNPEQARSLEARAEREKAKQAPRLDCLDAPRWLASIQIVFSHFYTNQQGRRHWPIDIPDERDWWNQLAYFGKNWTQFFFLLSGFVLAYAEFTRPPAQRNQRLGVLRYVRRRLITIYPTFFFSVLTYLLQSQQFSRITPFEWAMLPPTLLLMQSWKNICGTLPYEASSMCWNVPAWFLSALVLYWTILRPAADFFAKRSLAVTSCSLLALWACSFAPWLLEQYLGQSYDSCIMFDVEVGALGYVHVFLAGVATARLFMLTCVKDSETGAAPTEATESFELAPERAPVVFKGGCVLGYLMYLAYFVSVDMTRMFVFFHNGGILPILVLIVMGAALGVDPLAKHVFRTRLMRTLGNLSYAQYLMQFPVYFFFVKAFGVHSGPSVFTAKLPLGPSILYPFVLIAVAFLVQRYVQRPYTEWQQWRKEKGVLGSDEKLIALLERAAASLAAKCGACRP